MRVLWTHPATVGKTRYSTTLSSELKPVKGTMSELKEDNSASRVATYFVFIFLIAAIIETLIAGLGR